MFVLFGQNHFIMKRLVLLLLALIPTLRAVAGNPPIEVSRVYWWDKDYLSITWGGDITPDWRDNNSRACREYIISLLDNPSQIDKKLFWTPGDEPIYVGSRVVAVDGVDAKGWKSDRFYSAIESPFKHILTLEHPGKGQYEVVLGKNLPAWMTAAGFHPMTSSWRYTKYNQLPDGYRIRIDKDVAWRTFKTYDYYFSSDDVLADKELFETICKELNANGLKRDEENPDIVFTIVKDANKSVEYNYVPETVEHVQTGSFSTPVYGWKGQYLGSLTNNKYQTVKSGGYTQKTATTTAYLEIDVLEASRLGQKTLPLIWQLKYNYSNNTEADIDKLYSNAVTWFDWPIREVQEQKESTSCTRFFYDGVPLYNVGIILDAEGRVIGLDKNSAVVEKSGIRIGDVLKGLDVTSSRSFNTKKYGLSYSGTITVDRDGQVKKLSFPACKPVKSFGVMKFNYGRSVL